MTDDPRPDFAALAREASGKCEASFVDGAYKHALNKAMCLECTISLLSRVVQEREAQVWERAAAVAVEEKYREPSAKGWSQGWQAAADSIANICYHRWLALTSDLLRTGGTP